MNRSCYGINIVLDLKPLVPLFTRSMDANRSTNTKAPCAVLKHVVTSLVTRNCQFRIVQFSPSCRSIFFKKFVLRGPISQIQSAEIPFNTSADDITKVY